MKKLLLFLGMLSVSWSSRAQMDLSQGWVFHTGDNPLWAREQFADSGWKPIPVGHYWEEEGYPDYDGYAWYRLHFLLPSALKDSSFLRLGLRFQLGRIDDGDQVYLNGSLIGTDAGKSTDITQGNYILNRVYTIPLNSPFIHWDSGNVLAVRVYDRGGGGGMYEGPYWVRVGDITDYVRIDDQSHGFSFLPAKGLAKTILLKSRYTRAALRGELMIRLNDPNDGRTVWSRKVRVDSCLPGHPFRYRLVLHLPRQMAYQLDYSFREQRSGKSISVSEEVPYLLTPPPSPMPRIHGARVVGLRPGHPFLFKVPATGRAPLTYRATGLPGGLKLDPVSGIITGRVSKPGIYLVHLRLSNRLGMAGSDLKIVVGNQIALTPAMGWNSWNCWGLSVNDAKIRAAANAMKRTGLINHGWTYINIDDGWESPQRSPSGNIRPNAKFPDMRKMTAYIHSLGLKAGIYSSPGPKTCGGFTGSYQHEQQDADSYASWGIDYLKYDWCSYGGIYPHPDLAELEKPYRVMRSALDHTDRDLLFSFCQYGMGDVWSWGGKNGGNSWRTTGDIRDNWVSMSQIGFHQGAAAPYAKPGNWNDPDMLVVGKVGWGPSLHNTHLSPDEQYTHISLWCLLSAPLLIGCDMSRLDQFTLNLLSNDEVLALDQDPLGKEAVQVAKQGAVLIYAKDLADGSKGVGLFNTGSVPIKAILSFRDLGLQGPQELRDLWRQRDLGSYSGSFSSGNIPSHGVLLLRVIPGK